MKLQRLLSALIATDNHAADDLLLEALSIGNEQEQAIALETLIRRANPYGLIGVLTQYDKLPKPIQRMVIDRVKAFYHTLSEAGRSKVKEARLAAMKVIAASHQGKLGYVLSENLREIDEELSSAASAALFDLARWVNYESRMMHRIGRPATETETELVGADDASIAGNDSTIMAAPTHSADLKTAYETVMTQRPEIESAIARALDWARSKQIPDLLKAALLLCDHPESRILGILTTARHGGQASMVRRLQQPPSADHAEAFLLGASHGHLRANFAAAFAQITDTRVLDALLRRSHWLADHQLKHCLNTVQRGVWWDEQTMANDLESRQPIDAARIAQWICTSGVNDTAQDERLIQIDRRAAGDVNARLRILRTASIRPKQLASAYFAHMLNEGDERLVRMAAREIIRRRPPGYENLLLKAMTSAPESVRRVISRAIGQAGFEQYWNRFERMDRATRRNAGRAMLKLLPDAPERLGRYLAGGTIDQRVRGMQIIQELDLAGRYRDALRKLCEHTHAKVRSKAVSLLVDIPEEATGDIIERVLADTDPRVRANAIEVLEAKRSTEYVPMLTERVRSKNNRERANAIKALHRMKVGVAGEQLHTMLRDPRADHRISALWTLRHIGLWDLLSEVGLIAQRDDNLRVRRYAVAILRGIMEQIKETGGLNPPEQKVA